VNGVKCIALSGKQTGDDGKEMRVNSGKCVVLSEKNLEATNPRGSARNRG
jgi:hypothetical protein